MALGSLQLHGKAVRQCAVPLALLAAFSAVGQSLLAVHGLGPSRATELLWAFEFQLVLALWIRADRRARGFSVPFEFDTFVFFAWPLVLPHYLLRTRGGSVLFSAAGI